MRKYTDYLGQVLNQSYRLDSLIKVGGMGAVFRGSHTRLPKTLAIKVLHLDPEAYPDVVTRFQREAEVTAALHHPHIVEVADFNVAEGVPYLVMELLEGEDLDHRLRHEPPLTIAEVLLVLEQTTSALDAAHRNGVVHRDIKPSNIFLCSRPDQAIYAKVLDFGVSKLMGVQSNVTGTHASIGTPRYMAPEQARGRAGQVDERTDVFAMSTIAYEMFGGMSPFGGDSIPEVLYQIVHEEPEALDALRPDLPRALVAAIHRGMSKAPEHRQPTMAALWSELKMAADGGQHLQQTQIGDPDEFEPTQIASSVGASLAASTQVPTHEHQIGDVTGRPTNPRAKAGPPTPALKTTITGPPSSSQVARPISSVSGSSALSFEQVHSDPTVLSQPEGIGVDSVAVAYGAGSQPGKPARGLPVILITCAATLLLAGVGVMLFLWASDPGSTVAKSDSAMSVSTIPRTVEADAAAHADATHADATRVALKSADAKAPASRKLWISSKPSGARVFVDGQLLGRTPLEARAIEPGAKTVVVRRAGFRSETFRLDAGAENRLSATLHRAAPRSGTLRVMTLSGGQSLWAEIYIDGKKVGMSPLARPIKAGKYRVEARRAGYQTQRKAVTVRPGVAQRLTFDLKKR